MKCLSVAYACTLTGRQKAYLALQVKRYKNYHLPIDISLREKAIPSRFFPSIHTYYYIGRFTVMNVSNQTRGPKNGNETDFYYALR